MDITKKDVQQVAGSLQVCAGQDAGAMTVIHAVCHLFQQDETKEVLLVDTEVLSISSIGKQCSITFQLHVL